MLFQEVRLNVVSDKIRAVVALELINYTKNMGRGDEFFEYFKMILIGHVHGWVLVHEIWFVVFDGFEERTVLRKLFDELFFLVFRDHLFIANDISALINFSS